MDKFVSSIKKKYRERLLSHGDQWPPVSVERLINLQLVEADKKEGFRAGLPQYGAHNDDVDRTPILHGDLFNVKKGKKPVRKLIVEGNAGMGKTTLCTMIAEDWAEGKILAQFDCVLLLPLREKSVSSATTLPELFKLLHSSEGIRTLAVKELEEREGDGVLIIADGWDELDDLNRSSESFLYHLLFGNVLPFVSVLLSSRPFASASLHHLTSVDRLVEVVGFNEENLRQYIESEFENCPEKAYSLLQQLENSSLIQSLCSIPINCAIICNLWHTLNQALPTTLTKLYTQIVLNIILRDIQKNFPECSVLSLDNFDSIPSHLQDKFWLTCKFAYECLSRDQLVFAESELASVFPEHLQLESNKHFLCFGLLQFARSLLPVGHGLSFHFVHLTIQEFLAALHLTTLSTEEKQSCCIAHGASFKFAVVWRFVFGLGCKKQDCFSEKVICLDDELVNHLISVYGRSLIGCHFAVESEDPSISKKIALLNDGRLMFACSGKYDYMAIIHVLGFTTYCSNVRISVNHCDLKDEQLTELTDILVSSNGSLQVGGISMQENGLTDNGIISLFGKASASFKFFESLSVCNNSITNVMPLFSVCSNLTELSLSDNPLGVSGIQSLETAVEVEVLANLSSLHVSNTLTSDAGINGALFVTLLPSIANYCPHLRELDLSRNNFNEPQACIALGKGFVLLSNSRHSFILYLTSTKISCEAVSAFCNVIANCNGPDKPCVSQTCVLNLMGNPLGEHSLLPIVTMLRTKTCPITYLCLNNIDNTSSTDSGFHEIEQIEMPSLMPDFGPFIENKKLTSLSIAKNNFHGDKIFVLAECIRVCKSLKSLFSWKCSLTSGDIKTFLSNLKSHGSSHYNLTIWDISSNSIDDEGIDCLVNCLPELFPILEDIDFGGNPVSIETEERLKKYLKVGKERLAAQQRAEKEARRSTVVTEWERTYAPPQSSMLSHEFNQMWSELLEELIYCIIDMSHEQRSHFNFTPHEDNGLENQFQSPSVTILPSPSRSSHKTCHGGESTTQDSVTHNDENLHSVTEGKEGATAHPSPVGVEELTAQKRQIQSPRVDQQETSNDFELNLHTLTVELEQLTNPIKFGILLRVPQHILEIIKKNQPLDVDAQKIALFQYIAKNHKSVEITWSSIANALRDIHAGDLSLRIREKYCSQGGDSAQK